MSFASILGNGLDAAAQDAGRQVDRVARKALPGATFVPLDGASALTGSSMKFMAHAPGGAQAYVFKPFVGPRTAFEADRAAYDLRRAAGERAVSVSENTLRLPDGRVLPGSAKPLLRNQGALSSDPRNWTAAQRERVLADHPWMELLGNYDTKVDQYIRQGDHALNIDWDQAFSDYATNQPLTRFKALNKLNPPAQNLLYQAYVHGEVTLDFRPLFDTIGRIQGLSDAELRRELAPYTRAAFAHGATLGPYATPDDFMRAVLQRKSGLSAEFRRFVAQLQAERAYFHGHPTAPFSAAEARKNVLRDVQLKLAGFWSGSRAFVWWNQLLQHVKHWISRRSR